MITQEQFEELKEYLQGSCLTTDEAMTDLFELSEDDLTEKQIEDLKQGNDQLTSQLNYMQKIGGKLTQTHADFTKDLESIKELDEIIQSNFSKIGRTI